MGCDIHAIFQIYDETHSKWILVDVDELLWDEVRDYNVFTILSDCRSREPFKCICKPKGLPTDLQVSDGEYYSEGKYEICEKWLGDHSHSWFYLHELTEWWEEHYLDTDHHHVAYFFDFITALRAAHVGHNMRMVFGFDS